MCIRDSILACSTTMEMGVDLGNLEVVMLSSVPPQPSNYKQRAGRSGRNNKVCSVCITLCGSDAIGLRTLFNPLENIVNRPVQVPMVDLMSCLLYTSTKPEAKAENEACEGRYSMALKYYAAFLQSAIFKGKEKVKLMAGEAKACQDPLLPVEEADVYKRQIQDSTKLVEKYNHQKQKIWHNST